MGRCAAQQQGIATELPRKAPKALRPLRHGAHFWLTDAQGRVLLRRRPTRGLLGGMTEMPTTEWARDFDAASALGAAPLKAAWRRLPGVVSHVFTHFPLELTVYAADFPARTPAPAGMRWVAPGHLAGAALPSVMRKVILHKASQ